MFPRIAHLMAGVLLLTFAFVSSEAGAAVSGDARGRADKATQALFEAIHTNDFAATEAAVAAGANIDSQNRWNLTPVELAIDKGYFKIAHFLVSVRNNRAPLDAEAADKPVNASRAAAKSPAQTRPRQPAADNAADKALASEPAPQPWPSDKANPFDPAAPAFGAGLTVVAPAPSSRAESVGEELLATDTPASASRGYRN